MGADSAVANTPTAAALWPPGLDACRAIPKALASWRIVVERGSGGRKVEERKQNMPKAGKFTHGDLDRKEEKK